MTNKNIAKEFIVNEEDYSKSWAEKIAERALKHMKISKEGKPLIENDAASPDEKLKLALVGRFIAHSFSEEIPSEVTIKEVEDVLPNESYYAVGARMSKIANSGFATKKGRGKYVVQPYKIEPFLDSLEIVSDSQDKQGHGASKNNKRKRKQTTGGRGSGKDIMDLIESGFFDTPKTVSEAVAKLKQEVKYHNPRVVDAMIRKTFVSSKKLLKRIPNEEKGKAKWRYVIRK